ncbi:MAG: rod shape-determining protein MreD [Erysipelotrichaceae bacterium]|nr:rod shape-determining protein MreD [Erysipelotrichaceae bacterium]
MKKSSALILTFFLLAMLDSLLGSAAPIDFTYQHISIVWHICFLGMLIYLHDKPWVTRVSCAALIGIILDYFFQGSFPVCFILYPLFAWLSGLLPERMENDRFAFCIYMAACFLLDFIPYGVQLLFGQTNISLGRWLYCIELLTTLTNALSILALMYLDAVAVRFFLIQRSRARKAEQRRRLRRGNLETKDQASGI